MIPQKAKANPSHSDWDRFWNKQNTFNDGSTSWSKKRIMNVLLPYASVGKRALDAGCGSGFFSRFFCERGMDTVSFDYSDQALRVAADITKGRSKTVKGDLTKDALATIFSEKFDLIFSDGLLEHFEPAVQNKIIENFLSVLKNDGVLVTFVPNRFSPWELIRPFYMPGIEETPFVLSELLALNENAGLKVLARGGLNTFPFLFSPDDVCGARFGMLLYTISQKK